MGMFKIEFPYLPFNFIRDLEAKTERLCRFGLEICTLERLKI